MRTPVVIASALAVLVAGGAGAAVVVHQRGEAEQDRRARAAITALADGWSRRDLTGVPFADPDAAASLAPATTGLQASAVEVRPGKVTRDGELARADVEVSWTLPGGLRWTYPVPVTARRAGQAWLLQPPAQGSYWHPQLPVGAAMSLTRTPAERGDLLDRAGEALMPQGRVYPVQLDPGRATADVATRLERLVGEKAGVLAGRLAAAKRSGSKAPIAVITYRERDFQRLRADLDALPGVIYPATTQPLGPTREFGQPLLGSFGEVTAEVVQSSGGRYQAGDRAGLSGLQGRYDATLAGTPTVRVVITGDQASAPLFERPGTPGTDVALTLDPRVQAAAEKALVGTGEVPSALVAVDVATGEVLASANRPAFGFDRALTGRFPPGSAFKIASTYALLSTGRVALTTPVSCPARFVVDGRAFRNFEGESLGSPTFRQDVQHSCNTAFVQLAARLEPDDLQRAAAALGVGAGWGRELGVPNAVDGSVPVTTGATDQAAATIGQGRVLVSPLALAVMSGSVARGSYVPPRLLRTATAAPDSPAPSDSPAVSDETAASSAAPSAAPSSTPSSAPSAAPTAQPEPTPLDADAVAALRTVLRDVVTGGTATVLADTPGGPVSGKTGTAEFGSATPPRTHAWFTGYQGSIAFAVVVEEGRSGGSVAAPIAKAFLTELAR